MNPKSTNLKLVIESGLLAKVTSKIGQEKYLLLILCWKLILERIELTVLTEKNSKFLWQRAVVR